MRRLTAGLSHAPRGCVLQSAYSPRPPSMSIVTAADALANARSLDNAVNTQDRLVDEDAQLQQHGFPQFLIYALRSVGMDFPSIDRLPAPYSSAQARLRSSHSIAEVPSQALPSSFRA